VKNNKRCHPERNAVKPKYLAFINVVAEKDPSLSFRMT